MAYPISSQPKPYMKHRWVLESPPGILNQFSFLKSYIRLSNLFCFSFQMSDDIDWLHSRRGVCKVDLYSPTGQKEQDRKVVRHKNDSYQGVESIGVWV